MSAIVHEWTRAGSEDTGERYPPCVECGFIQHVHKRGSRVRIYPAPTWRNAFQVPHSLHEVSFRRCCLTIMSNTRFIPVKAMKEMMAILGPKKSSLERLRSLTIPFGTSEGDERFSKRCMVVILSTDFHGFL